MRYYGLLISITYIQIQRAVKSRYREKKTIIKSNTTHTSHRDSMKCDRGI